MEDAAAVESGGMRQPAGGNAVAVENWMSSDSIADCQELPTLVDNLRRNWRHRTANIPRIVDNVDSDERVIAA